MAHAAELEDLAERIVVAGTSYNRLNEYTVDEAVENEARLAQVAQLALAAAGRADFGERLVSHFAARAVHRRALFELATRLVAIARGAGLDNALQAWARMAEDELLVAAYTLEGRSPGRLLDIRMGLETLRPPPTAWDGRGAVQSPIRRA